MRRANVLQWVVMSVLVAFVACGGEEAEPAPAPAAPAGGVSSTSAPSSVPARPVAFGPQGTVVARYETRVLDPVLEEIRDRDESWKKAQSEETSKIRARQTEEEERERREKLVLRSELSEAERPSSLAAFTILPHRPPAAQFYTGTCWSFAATSLLESEIQRVTGRPVKLSEMATVYHEYLDKASRFVAERGGSLFAQGSQASAVTRVWERYGAWPQEAYPGVLADDGRHDHLRMFREMEGLLGHVRSGGLWDEATVRRMLRVILDRHMGRPPETFPFDGKTVRPENFLAEVLQVDPRDYVSVMSTMQVPYYTQGEFEVPDNWSRESNYHNVPLAAFYESFKQALERGFTAVVALDVSEPGKDAEHDVLFVPPYDIPAPLIDQAAREYRLASKVTTDDHGIHVVGYTHHAGHDWFLAKDSGRSARRGPHKGYYFVRGDYVRLKVLVYFVHRDAVPELLARFPSPD